MVQTLQLLNCSPVIPITVEDGFGGRRHQEGLVIYLGPRDDEVPKALRDRVGGSNTFQVLGRPILAPTAKAAGSPVQGLEDFREVRGADGDEAEAALLDLPHHPVYPRVIDVAMPPMAPPDQDVGCGQYVFANPLLGIADGPHPHIEVGVLAQMVGDGSVDTVGIDAGRLGPLRPA